MRYILLLILSGLLLSGCSKKEEKETEPEKPKVESTEQIQVKASDSASYEGAGLNNPDASDSLIEIKYGIKEIPKSLKYTGKIAASASWKDKNGLNVLLITETKDKKVRDEKMDGKYLEQEAAYSKEFFGYQFLVRGDTAELLWKIQDLIKECEADLTLDYITNSLSVTDINKNGIGESTFLYTLGCRSDVSPLGYKLLMHEGKDKYAIRGTRLIIVEGAKPYGGEMKADPSFDTAPAGFFDYAKKQWKKFEKEKFNTE
ncbi:MAG: hypothetical protein WC139_00110 [Candidatus Kapaibacterium sp.]